MTSALKLLLLTAYLAVFASAGVVSGRNASEVSAKPFVWASLGDSWASGVAYGLPNQTSYDSNWSNIGRSGSDQDGCRRNKQAYSVRLSSDNSWTPEGRPQDFHFQSCMGTQFTQLDRVPHQGHIQLDDVPVNIDMIMLQAGHDNADLAAVAAACVYTPPGMDFGAAWPDSKGNCSQEIARASSYIKGKNEDQLFQDVRRIVNSIFESDKVKSRDHFQLFMPGYAQVFFAEDGNSDWCGNVSFAVRDNDRPLLTLALRQAINQLLQDLNAGIKAGIAGSSYSDRTHFIDIDAQFDGHRFCQPEHQLDDQFTGDKVYLWNMSPAEANATDSGMSLRPFHPKRIGYSAMNKAIRPFLNAQYGTMTAMESPDVAGPNVPLYNSIQFLFAEHKGYFSWYGFKGPQGKKVNPCPDKNRWVPVVDNMLDPRPHKDLALVTPPTFPANANWEVKIEGWSDHDRCRIAGSSDGPGALRCGNPPFLDYPITSDNSHNDPIIRCKGGDYDGLSFKRSWNIEW